MTEEQFNSILRVALRQYVENSVESVEAFTKSEPEIEFSDRIKRRKNKK